MELAEIISKIDKINPSKKRIVIITCGPEPARVSEYDFKEKKITFSKQYEPELVDEEKIVDANGAGDAFAGGFLAYRINGHSIDESVKAGHKAAAVIIQKRGCQFPEFCNFQLK